MCRWPKLRGWYTHTREVLGHLPAHTKETSLNRNIRLDPRRSPFSLKRWWRLFGSLTLAIVLFSVHFVAYCKQNNKNLLKTIHKSTNVDMCMWDKCTVLQSLQLTKYVKIPYLFCKFVIIEHLIHSANTYLSTFTENFSAFTRTRDYLWRLIVLFKIKKS